MKKIFLSIIVISVLWGCKKELDFNKFKDISLSPEIGLPLATFELNMKDLLNDSNVKSDPDGFLRYIRRTDSIASFPVDSFIKIPNLDPVNLSNKLGLVDIDDTSVTETRTLGALAENFSAANKKALEDANGTVSIFPGINDQNSNVTVLPFSSNQFTSINIASGYLVLEFKNELKVTVDQLTINIINMVPFQVLVGQLIFRNVAPGGTKKDSLNMTGMSLSSSLAYSLPIFRTFASSSPVLIDLNDGLRFSVKTKNLKASGGVVIFPTQTINAQSLKFDLKAEDSTARIRNIAFESGKINYSVSSNIDEQLSIKISIEGALKNGLPMAPIIINVKNQTKTGEIDLANVLFDLSLDPTQPYNKVNVKVEPTLISSNTLKNFDSSNFVNASFSFGTLKFQEVNGYLGNQVFKIDPTEEEFSFLEEFDSGFPFDDPKIRIFTSNSIGVPVEVSLDAKGISAKGLTQDLNAPKFTIGYPTMAQKGQVIDYTKTIDKTNSSIVAMLNLPPKKILFGGQASINPLGFKGYNDFIVKGSGITVGYEVEMPLSLKTSSLVIKKTDKNALFNIENDSLKESIFGTDLIEYVDLLLKIDNAIPFDMKLDLFFASKDTVIKDTIAVGLIMNSSIPDANGRTIKNTTTLSSVRITKAKLDEIKKNNLTQMVVHMTVITFDKGSQPVKIYSDYVTKIGMSAKAKLKQ